MMCMEVCGRKVQGVLGGVRGVKSVTVHFPTRSASVQVEPGVDLSPKDLISPLEEIGFKSSCISTSTAVEPTLESSDDFAIWAIASTLGLVDRGCAMAWGDECNCGDGCKCINCPQHMHKVTKAMDLLMKAVELSSGPEVGDSTTPSVTAS
ncbi:unnamed protein product [Discosporangium mesarthrocarpum]